MPNYPTLLRSALARTGVPINVSNPAAPLLVSTFDRLFAATGEATVTLASAELKLDLAQPPERLLYYAGPNVLRAYRRSELYRVLRSHADPSLRFVDVGANLGLFSLLARELGMRALLFEPEPQHRRFLERNASVFGTVSGLALSDVDGTAEFFVADPRNSGASSLVGLRQGSTAGTYAGATSVQVSTFDTALAQLDVDGAAIGLIKIDVEGNEERTVRGMSGYLSEHGAPVWCEVRGPTSDRGARSYEGVTRLMGEHGYTPHVSSRGRIEPFKPTARLPQVFDLLLLKG
ncbi:MAG: hypothetical protein QOE36_1138 [Gaiellaceae bacterium]|nr:hypothetical protein [Gaiellaceae bacterium]